MVSLLYYFGMLTTSGMHEGKTKFIIPNLGIIRIFYSFIHL